MDNTPHPGRNYGRVKTFSQLRALVLREPATDLLEKALGSFEKREIITPRRWGKVICSLARTAITHQKRAAFALIASHLSQVPDDLMLLAARYNEEAMARTLLQRGGQINASEKETRRTVLHLFAANNNKAMTEWLLDNGADGSLLDHDGVSALELFKPLSPDEHRWVNEVRLGVVMRQGSTPTRTARARL